MSILSKREQLELQFDYKLTVNELDDLRRLVYTQWGEWKHYYSNFSECVVDTVRQEYPQGLRDSVLGQLCAHLW